MASKIVIIEKKYGDSLTNYLHKIYPNITDEYAQYCVGEALNVDEPKSLLVIDDNDQIAGCHLFFETKAWINGEERKVVWGHDTFLDEEYRHELGLDFVFAIATVRDHFGYGLSEVNRKIQKRMPTIAFIGNGMRKYCLFNPWVAWGTIQRVLRVGRIPKRFPTELRVKGSAFSICSSPEEINIPDGGYWNRECLDVDFVRDESFLDKRFFHNPVHHYFVYVSESRSSYFVVRPILFKGFPTLFVVDFRYNMNCPDMLNTIFDAAEALCRQLHMGVMLFTTNDNNVEARYSVNRCVRTKHVDLIANKKRGVISSSIMLVTSADSDGEFRK